MQYLRRPQGTKTKSESKKHRYSATPITAATKQNCGGTVDDHRRRRRRHHHTTFKQNTRERILGRHLPV